MSVVSYDPRAPRREAWMSVPIQEPKTSLLSRVWTVVAYTSVVVGVGVAVFIVSPANARDVGVMNHEARVIRVSPSISVYGDGKIQQKLRADIARDNNKAFNQMELENLRSDNDRALAADKAYYEKLKDQRKHK